jgi:hypothetical protein
MTRTALMAVATIAAFADTAARGLPPRSSASDYAAQAEDNGVRIAAEVLSSDQVQNLFATDLSKYVVVEVAVWPKTDSQLDLSPIDFGLRTDSNRGPVRPASSRTIAAINQKRGQSRRDDIVLYPSVGVSTGTWGTGTHVGVGVGMGGGAPGPASTDGDRRTMELELDERALPDQVITKPAAGYLFFPAAAKSKKVQNYELHYDSDAAKIRLALPAS